MSAPAATARTSTDGTPGTAPRLGAELFARLADLVTAAPGRPRQVSRSPLDGAPVGEVPTGAPADVATAVTRARAAQRAWAARPVRERCAVALRFHDLVLDRADLLVDLVQTETGKARADAHEEVLDVAATARYYGRSAPGHLRPRRRQGAVPVLTRVVEHRHPVGVVGVISPWNYPLTLAVSDALPALLAGNAVVLKPDAQTPFSALMAVTLLRQAGLPPDLLQVVTGDGARLGPALIDAVDHVMFTGSTATGRSVARRCGERLIGCSAELGGKNAMIVLADADLPAAVAGAVRSCFASAGQLCMSIERIYVADAVYDRFRDDFTDRVRQLRLGGALDWTAQVGPLVGERQLAVVTRHVSEARAGGARVLTGGRARPDLGPLFYEPTVLEGVTAQMAVAQEETFGPVVALYRVRGEAEAVARANEGDYGLTAAVWSTPRRGARLAARLVAGTVSVNDGYPAVWGSHDAPLGGMRRSGLGRRHGRAGILTYTEAQVVAVQRGFTIPPAGMTAQRGARVMTTALRVLRRLPGRR